MKDLGGRPYLEIGGRSQWDSMEHFEADLEDWRIRNFVVLLRRDSKTSRAYNLSNNFKPGNPHYIDEVKSRFAYKTWKCVHFGQAKIRKREGTRRKVEGRQAMGCDFRIHAAFKPFFDKVCCSVKVHGGPDCLPNGHNHELSESRFLKYKQTRKLSEDQKRRQRVLMNLGTPAREALNELRRSTGVEYTMAAIYNFRRKERLRPPKEMNELDSVNDFLADYKRSFPSLLFEVVTTDWTEGDAEQGVNEIEVETRTLQAIHLLLPGGRTFSSEFGEVLFMDGIIKATIDSLGVLLLAVEDGFGRRRTVQASLLASGDGAAMVESALQFYKKHAGGKTPSTILTHKDCNETAAIKSVLSGAEILLCRWHVIECLKQQIAVMVEGTEVQRTAENLVYRMAYSKGEDDYEEKWELLKSLLRPEVRNRSAQGSNSQFLEYFQNNWHHPEVRKLWVQYCRKFATTFSSDAKSRAEEIERLLKTFKLRSSTLAQAVGDLLKIGSDGMRNFKDLTYDDSMLETASGDRNVLFFQEFSTLPAFKIIKRELVFSQLYEVDSRVGRDADIYKVVRRDDNLDGMDGLDMFEDSSYFSTVVHNTESQKVITAIIGMSKTSDGQCEKELSDTHGGVGVQSMDGEEFPSISEPLFKCSCTIYLNYGALPCRHIFALALYLYRTTSISQLIPKRWSRVEMARVAVAVDQELAAEGRNRRDRNAFYQENVQLSDALRSANESEKEPFRTCRRVCKELAATIAFSRLETSVVVKIMCVVLALTDAAKRSASPDIGDIQRAMSISDSVKLEDFLEGRIEMGHILRAWRASTRRRDRSETRTADVGREVDSDIGEIRIRRKRSIVGNSETEMAREGRRERLRSRLESERKRMRY